ncbi:MAG TPA: hypothetical protein VEL50_06455 [Gemmatimonadales bacterium]|nr:hypothetical protein [Gemmatimonadales bacterium]
MQLGEILDGSFNIYRRHFGLFMRLSLALVWLPTAAGIYMQVRFSNTPFEMLNILEQHTGTTVLFGLLLIVVWTTAGLLLKAGTIRIISDSYLGQEPQLGSALRFGVSKILPLLLVTFSKNLLLILVPGAGALVVVLLVMLGKVVGAGVGGLIGFVGFVGLAWFVVWVACVYGTTTPIVVLEDLTSSFDAFGRSWELTRGARGKVFGTAVVAWLISQLLPQMVVGGISGALGAAGNTSLQPLFVVVASLMGIVLAPILPCAITLLYYDLRVRREAFDLQVLSEQMGIR